MRGQSAFEFTVLMAFGMLLMITLLVIGINYSQEHVENQRLQALLQLGYSLQDELILATTVHEGYEHDVDLPEQLGRFFYDIETTETTIRLLSGGQTQLFLIPNTTGTFEKGRNTIRYDGELTII